VASLICAGSATHLTAGETVRRRSRPRRCGWRESELGGCTGPWAAPIERPEKFGLCAWMPLATERELAHTFGSSFFLEMAYVEHMQMPCGKHSITVPLAAARHPFRHPSWWSDTSSLCLVFPPMPVQPRKRRSAGSYADIFWPTLGKSVVVLRGVTLLRFLSESPNVKLVVIVGAVMDHD
jgi:hypothetical protein